MRTCEALCAAVCDLSLGGKTESQRLPLKPSAEGSGERGGPTSNYRICRTVTLARGAGRSLGCAALRGSSASGAGASIARGCPPRTSPPPAADLRAEARTHLPRCKVRFARNALREWAFLAPLSCS